MTPLEVRERVALPWDDRARMRDVARGIVVLASGLMEDKAARSWLLNDERGTWETIAHDLLEKTPEMIAGKISDGTMTQEEVGDGLHLEIGTAIAHALAFRAVAARMADVLGSPHA